MTACTVHRMGDVFERCACCGSTHEVAHIMYPEGWPICGRCNASDGADRLREDLYALPTTDRAEGVTALALPPQPVCKRCTASGGPELLRDELYGGDAA